MAQTDKDGQEKVTAIFQDIREICSQNKEESEAISKIIIYAEENDLRYLGLDFHRTGSVTFRLSLKHSNGPAIRLRAKFNG